MILNRYDVKNKFKIIIKYYLNKNILENNHYYKNNTNT
jgi:hypothetical protein